MKSRKPDNKRIEMLNSSDFGLGKLPPQDIATEEVILGAIMLEKSAINEVSLILTPECFYKDSNRIIFSAILALKNAYEPIDIVTVTNYLKKSGELDNVGGPFHITQLTYRVGSGANINAYCKVIFEKYIAREIIRSGTEMVKNAYSEELDIFEILASAGKTVDNLNGALGVGKVKTFKQMVIETYSQIHAAHKDPHYVFGQATGFKAVDEITGGRVGGELTILASRPGMGKTTRMLQEVINIAKLYKKPVGVFSLEMPFSQMIVKFLANQTTINSNKVRTGKVNGFQMDAIARAAEELQNLPIYLCDIATLHINQLCSQARQWKSLYDIQALYVDYLQLVTGDKENKSGTRDQEVGTISRGLKKIAMELNIPVIALSQLIRSVDTRSSKKPMLSDLRESGNIEQDADVVEFLYRPDYYGIEYDADNMYVVGLVQDIIAKNRNGALDEAYLKFKKEYSMLFDFVNEEDERPPAMERNVSIESRANTGEDTPF